jgi:hypothetical protein
VRSLLRPQLHHDHLENANLMSHRSVKSHKQRDYSRTEGRFIRQIVCKAVVTVGVGWIDPLHVITTTTQTYQQTSRAQGHKEGAF